MRPAFWTLLAISIAIAVAAHAQAASLKPRTDARVLFSGHSLMDNPITDWVESIARARGDKIGWEQQIGLGSPIRVRTLGMDPNATTFTGYARGENRRGQNKDILAELASPTMLTATQKYDTLVITERHNILGTTAWEGTIKYLRHFHDRMVERNPDARTLFYTSWWGIDKSDPKPWIELQRVELTAWECAASKVNLSLAKSGKPQAVRVLPAASALALFVERALAGDVPGISGTPEQKLSAIFGDDVHLLPPGAYLMSAVIYAGVYGKSPVGANAVAQIPKPMASVIEQIAWDVVSKYDAQKGSSRTMDECKKLVERDVCPVYFGYRKERANCGLWSSPKSPYAWPDASLPQ